MQLTRTFLAVSSSMLLGSMPMLASEADSAEQAKPSGVVEFLGDKVVEVAESSLPDFSTVKLNDGALLHVRQSPPDEPYEFLFSGITLNVKVDPDEMFQPTEIPGIQMLIDQDARVTYVSSDASSMLSGTFYRFSKKSGTVTDLTARHRGGRILELIDPSDAISFKPSATNHTIYVFTDISCYYCRELHSHMNDYHKAGIEVRYLAYPRSGLDSDASDDLDTAWCSEDQQTAMTELKAGRNVPKAVCSSPVARHYELGRMLQIRGTPAILTERGDLIGGWVPADDLLRLLRTN